ncbi:MAG: hypothetical protein ABI779_15610 [Acidobacteriota bacterium]
MNGQVRAALGSLAGAGLAVWPAMLVRPWFRAPVGGVGAVTVAGYPKSWDYAVIALLVFGAFVGGAIASWSAARPATVARVDAPARSRWMQLAMAVIVFVLMIFMHDHPYAPMDPFHEGEHLTAGWLLKSGQRPYRDFYIFHGLATDAGLDALALGDPPSPLGPRRLQTILDAATLALLVPIAFELLSTTGGVILGLLLSLSACAAFWLPVFPYFRLAPVLLAVLGLLRYQRSGRAGPLLLAFAASTLGVLWSLDTGMYTLAGTIIVMIALRLLGLEEKPVPLLRVLLLAALALALPLLVLLAVRADLRQFFVDSFVIMPGAIDAVWALPAPAPFTANGVRYYLPPLFYGFLLALALVQLRRGNKREAAHIGILTLFSLLLFRTAAGRVSWSHTRFAMPLLGLAMTAFVLEPLLRATRNVRVLLAGLALAAPMFFYFEVRENLTAGAKLLAGWPARLRHEGLVEYPFPTGRGIYSSPQNATDLAALQRAIDGLGPPDATILDFSNERALHYLLQRRSPLRCMEISMLSVPRLLAEAMAQLNANPPLCVVVSGDPAIASFDGVSNRDRVPALAAWIDANYPKRVQAGRFTLATR